MDIFRTQVAIRSRIMQQTRATSALFLRSGVDCCGDDVRRGRGGLGCEGGEVGLEILEFAGAGGVD